ncbi:hypothetical protein AGLY_012362 [Aphis glycines]|uniref:RING-type E3 ubiquitin transferase n=1 Tax=Aphis glycines TaxID=307491 RepID=A0A6G0T9U5_APHGL|nr:hypothetical protein AGLY_012362 [Aphis glycines]
MLGSRSSSVIVVAKSSNESLIGFPIDPPTRFPTESPMDSASSSKTSTRSTAKRSLEDKSDEASSCTICLDKLTSAGLHKPVCLKCGHIFGEHCLKRWILTENENGTSRCPICNAKAILKDLRVLYAENVVTVDHTAEITAVERKLKEATHAKHLMEMEAERWRSNAETLDTEAKRLKRLLYDGHTEPAACQRTFTVCKNQSCGVMAYNKNNRMLVMSQQSDTTTLDSYVIRKMDVKLMKLSKEYICVHKKQIRDMVFHPLHDNLLASVGLDSQINLTDLNINTVVSSMSVPEPLWSCCWAGDNTHVLVVGSQTGSVYYIDRRCMKIFNSEQIQKLGCVSLNILPPSSSRSFKNGGFLKARMDHLSVLEEIVDNDYYTYKETELPLTGLWSSTSYDCQSNLVLTSARPYGPFHTDRHIVSKFADFNEKGPVLSQVVTFYGRAKSTQIYRSCLVPSSGGYNDDPLVCCYDEGSGTIDVFNINKKKNVHGFKVNDNILDLCPLPDITIQGRRTVAGLSKNTLIEIMNKVPPSVCRLIARASHVLISLSISLCGTVLYIENISVWSIGIA